MYSMVEKSENVMLNVNQIYMAGLRRIWILILELPFTKNMYRKERRNFSLHLSDFGPSGVLASNRQGKLPEVTNNFLYRQFRAMRRGSCGQAGKAF